jgi:MFS family permease
MIMWLGFFLTFMALQITLGFYLQDELGISDPKRLVTTVSLLLVSMALTIVVVQIGVLQRLKVRPVVLMRLLGPLFVLALLIMYLAESVPVMAVGFAVLGISFACANPGINGSASLCVEPWEQGATAGFLSVGNTLGAILGPLVGTQLYTHLGHEAPLLGGMIALALLSVYALRIKVPDGQQPKPAPASATPNKSTGE